MSWSEEKSCCCCLRKGVVGLKKGVVGCCLKKRVVKPEEEDVCTETYLNYISSYIHVRSLGVIAEVTDRLLLPLGN